MAALELEVWLGPVFVGHLSQGSDYRTRFVFDESYLERPRRPVLGQWFEDRLGAADLRGRFGSLPAFFDNVLPSRQLRRLIRLQHDLENPTDAELLACVGEDLPGAVIVRDPTRSLPVGFADAPTIDDETEDGQLRLHFSLAGLQLKFSLVKDGRVLTLPAGSNVGRVIAKIPTVQGLPGVVENEYTVMEWARRTGFDVPACEICDAKQLKGIPALVHGTKIYVVERFDRDAGRRVHQEDLAQVLGIASEDAVSSTVSFEYSDVCRVVGGLLGESGCEEFVRRLALVVASGNEDAHLKNWAIVYPDGVTPTWAPLYDQLSTIAWSRGSQGLTLDFGGVRDWTEIEESVLARFATRAGLQPQLVAEWFDETLSKLSIAWRELERPLSLDSEHATALAEHWTRVPLLRRHGPLS